MNKKLIAFALAMSVGLSACGVTSSNGVEPLSQRVSDLRADEAGNRACFLAARMEASPISAEC
jgi:hypothetical protein